ncbi:MAG TPA: GAF domain-containing protein, partial [Pseudolysinimonas sp.]|nr:GAF domain-containing protein [Pseudolysinimonas sp.]
MRVDRSQRQALLVETLVTMADTLVAGYDVPDLLQTLVERSGELLGSSAGGILLADADQRLQIVASSNDSVHVVEVMQVAGGSGPCVESYRGGQVVSVPDLELEAKWPEFRRVALAEGFRSVHAVPLRLRETTIGSMNLFGDEPGEMVADDITAAQALADVATIGILQQRALREASVAQEQLQRALDSRVVIEQ